MRRRFSIIELLALVAVAALGLAAMRDGSDLALRATMSVMMLGLVVALLGALLRTKPAGAWAGFALLGWTTFLLSFIPYFAGLYVDLPFALVIEAAAEALHPKPARPLAIPNYVPEDPIQLRMYGFDSDSPEGQFRDRVLAWDQERTSCVKIGQAISCLLAALVGSLLGRFLASRRESASPAP